MTESPEHRLKRLHMRSWRRGMKEMDLILGRFADDHLANLDAETLAIYEELLTENDQDLYLWVTARLGGAGRDDAAPDHLRALLTRIAGHASAHLAGDR
ncbi:succinate dehydrogenase assembly factor 2 [Paracoccus sp. (in: a-proteobacteria)]|uniref:FAD assembly factor SdhE n=1 Tax=Paracoccus sp. TaxID=267 RepID=UPI0026E0FED8|nr:succinate dehydrogenase assembly factor 2 [Paracoccus sp. (in: a-proteobacteria)]MDO5648952.1 succinate dehydrogenase assembly factor 2 [Paracoccus sp. (in: a-proteobacteria)]